MALPAAVWTDSPTVSPKSSRKPANSTQPKDEQRLAGYVGISETGPKLQSGKSTNPGLASARTDPSFRQGVILTPMLRDATPGNSLRAYAPPVPCVWSTDGSGGSCGPLTCCRASSRG